jgi:CBS-domain-containing membrane protein
MSVAEGVIPMRSTVKDVMTTRVVAVRENASFKEMITKMRDSLVSAFPVIDHAGRVVGVVSEADMLNKEADQASPGTFASLLRFHDHEKAAGVTAADLMTSPAVTIGPDEPVADAARLMRDRRIKRLPVTSATGHLIGIISRVDVLSVFCHPDGTIRHEVMDEVVRGGFLVRSQPYGVVVHDGIVTLTGRPETDQAGHDLVERVRRIEGVVTVRDRLSYAGTKVP